MRYHHTKTKGDLGVAKAIADMVDKDCPDTSRCYYIDPRTWDRGVVKLRLAATRNNQAKGIRWARDYLEIPSTVRGIPAGEGSGLVGWGWVRQSPESRAS